MPAAPQTNNDVEMIEVLQVGSEEVVEAIKTLQRALGEGECWWWC
jgi:abelson tyrosine-protein kinase 1